MSPIDPQSISSLDAQLRTERFQKDPFVEDALLHMNAGLRWTDEWVTQHVKNSGRPNVLVCGVPRSGTTLIVQMLASRLRVGYCSNLMARFYEAPSVGALLQKELLGDRIHSLRSFASEHGVTRRIEEPNEFGYFWSRHLGVTHGIHEPTADEASQVDLDALQRELDAISAVLDRPTVLKCMMGVFFVPVLKRLRNTVFVHVERDWADVASSIYRTRSTRLGSPSHWWSFRPHVYVDVHDASPEIQIAAQIRAIQDALSRGLHGVPDERKIHVRYEELVSNPENVVSTVAAALARLGHPVAHCGRPLPLLRASVNRLPSTVTERLDRALKQQNLI